MKTPRRGEVWLVDLGHVAKVRPALVLSVPVEDEDRALVTLVSRTTSSRSWLYLHLPLSIVRILLIAVHVPCAQELGR